MTSISILQGIITCSFLFVFAPWIAEAQPGIFNVLNFGAVADGKTDSAKAFTSAWAQACGWTGNGTLVIPEGTYLASKTIFQGPCKGTTSVQLDGTIRAPPHLSGDDWFSFQHIDGLIVTGTGSLDGQGAQAWAKNNCHKNDKCKFPVNLRLQFVTDTTVTGITSIDSKFFHIAILGVKNLKFHNVNIKASADSVNTDGIHISRSNGVEISGSVIGTGDDCISFGDGANGITLTGITCGPGHGISIGSLGKNAGEEPVTGVTVTNCTFTNTDNGVRIKTWPDSHPGQISNITFQDMVMNNVGNPIFIDQEYCPYNKCNKQKPSLVKISDITFRNIRGTSSTNQVVQLACSNGVPCQGVTLADIDLKYTGPGGPITSTCTNAKITKSGKTSPAICA